ncbi:Calcium/calmodulin-dependent protein kinase type 1 [Tritrichomonas foetus]|uniref:Calcium/calmodulin-dependent protein kinase type 1 n=1 Tax=Tritrichomonas foetus TaxID=1144522 RepID=A0A1J4JUV8_9EUKA|nr:Calcium/calmodulin-dependent protein kinase type 1 [Tritrichomonas foetus]|eukprot:OHT02943.1 Calcium/calmodulin-dependent protein kinase type 1 [Tritrichomonas foetus]
MFTKNTIVGGRYRFIEELGRGGFSIVMKACDIISQEYCAIKIINLQTDVNVLLMKREVEILTKMNHPCVVKLYDWFEEDGNAYIVMELVEGCDLLNFINESKYGIPENIAKKLFSQMLSGMIYIHSLNICHRDIKPENFLITKALDVKIIDFGLSKGSIDNVFCTTCGTLVYSSPERILGHQYTSSADVWSLGIILYAMINGELPFYSENNQTLVIKILKEDPKIWPKKNSESFVDLLNKFLKKNFEERITLQEAVIHPWINDVYTFVAEQVAEKKIKNRVPQFALKFNKLVLNSHLIRLSKVNKKIACTQRDIRLLNQTKSIDAGGSLRVRKRELH